MDQIELNCVITLNWIILNRTVFCLDIETVYLRQTELFEMEQFFDIETVWKQKSILILSLIIWNRTVYLYKNGICIYNLQCCAYKTKPTNWILYKKSVNFWAKIIDSESCKFCICIFAFINQPIHWRLVLNFVILSWRQYLTCQEKYQHTKP